MYTIAAAAIVYITARDWHNMHSYINSDQALSATHVHGEMVAVPLQSMATSSEWTQLRTPNELLGQLVSLDSEPEHLTLSNQIDPVADP